MRSMRFFLARCLLALLFACAAGAAFGQAPLKIGVLAYRPKPQTLAQWQPVAAYLQEALGRRIEIAAYDHAEMANAASRRIVDVVVTTPNHYILLQRAIGLSAPLATLRTYDGKHESSAYGGVIVASAGRGDIGSLADLAGKRIAATSPDAFGSYQMQAAEMVAAGVPLPKGEKMLYVGQPNDKVPRAVLEGRADIGFVRSGVIEAMVREGKLDIKRIKIVNRQNYASYPYVVSTPLYPEWPVAVMPHVDEKTATRLVAALLLFPRERSGNLAGFTVPADYDVVQTLMRRLRLPPFERAQDMLPASSWSFRYGAWSLAVLLAVACAWLAVEYRRVRQSMREMQSLMASISREEGHRDKHATD